MSYDKSKLLDRMYDVQDSHHDATGMFLGPDQLYDRVVEEARSMGMDVDAMLDDGIVSEIADETWVPN